ncbi:MAG TPA: hypothetical protein VKE69_10860 [Planctomycetota bacterium]|nr:hypothetical protein [Planctomycetota bacterium]
MIRRGVPRVDESSSFRGFSVVEILILVTASLLIAGISVPVLRGIRLAQNADSALETLVRLRDAEERFRETGAALGPAGSPRYGTPRELVAEVGLGELEDARVVEGGEVLQRHGYLFQVYFATTDSYVEDPTDPAALAEKDAFVVYAWPLQRGQTGTVALAIDPGGRLRGAAIDGALESKNLLRRYSGLGRRPLGSAAQRPDAATSTVSTRRQAVPGVDGEVWEVTPLPP